MAKILIGLALGIGVGVSNFRILVLMTQRIASITDTAKANRYAVGVFALRTFIFIAFVLAAVYIDWINVYAAGGGLLLSGLINVFLGQTSDGTVQDAVHDEEDKE